MSAMLGFVSRLLSWLLSVLDGCFGGVEVAGDGMNFLGLTELVASSFSVLVGTERLASRRFL